MCGAGVGGIWSVRDRAIAFGPDDPRGYNPKSTYLRQTHRANEPFKSQMTGWRPISGLELGST